MTRYDTTEFSHPERLTAALIAAELKEVIAPDAEAVDAGGPAKRYFTAPSGATVTLDMDAARVIVATDRYRLDLTVTQEHLAIGYVGEYGPDAFAAMFLLDYLHEAGMLPTNPGLLSAEQLAQIGDLRERHLAGKEGAEAD
jgi:hypothetical protein